jgi:hypothetical protein
MGVSERERGCDAGARDAATRGAGARGRDGGNAGRATGLRGWRGVRVLDLTIGVLDAIVHMRGARRNLPDC